MNDERQIIAVLKEEFNRWEDVLAGLSEEQITARQLPANLSIKDVIRPFDGMAATFHRTPGGCPTQQGTSASQLACGIRSGFGGRPGAIQ